MIAFTGKLNKYRYRLTWEYYAPSSKKGAHACRCFLEPPTSYILHQTEKEFGGSNCKIYLPGQSSEFGGLDGKNMFDDAGGLQPSLQNVDYWTMSAGEKDNGKSLN